MFKVNPLYRTDGYKLGHRLMLAPGTKKLYGQWIPRSVRHASKGITKIVSFGQQLTWKWLHDEWQENFFKVSKDEAIKQAGEDFSAYLGTPYNKEHFEALYDLGYLPIRVKSLPEGIETLPNIPHQTFINTVDGFGWLTLYLETIVSSLSWKPTTSATIAKLYKRNFIKWVIETDPDNLWLVDYLGHDFSARGLSPWDMISSGLGHATSFRGSDTLAVIPAARYFYGEPFNEVIINSVNASEHSVSTTCIFTMGELEMVRYYMRQFPTGILSLVMDTMDLTRVVKPVEGGYLHTLKDEILARNGKIVIRPDSSPTGRTPADIICGHDKDLTERELQADYPEFYHKGLIQCLWEIFGGTINKQGYKVLDPHIGAIYGDSITPDIQVETFERLKAKGFAATNNVLGIGSFTYQYNTRDTLGWAAKGGYVEIGDNSYALYKDPITDSGMKKSPRGLLRVDLVDNECILKQNCTLEEESGGILQIIYEDGKFFNQTTFTEIRNRLNLI